MDRLLVVSLVFCAVTAFLARRKGYNPFIWFFAGGIIGLLVLAFLPFTNKGSLHEEERARQVKSGNIIGGVIAAVAVVFFLFRIFVVVPAEEVKLKRLEKDAKVSLCEVQAMAIIIALDEYTKWHYMNYTEGPHVPESLDDPEFKDRFLGGELPQHPSGLDWNDYYNPDEPMAVENGKFKGPIDTDRACSF